MINQNITTLKNECLQLLQYYLKKTDSIMKIYKDTSETRYFLFALKGTKASIKSETSPTKTFLLKCINTLIEGQKNRSGNSKLNALRSEIEEELSLLKLRYNLD